MSRLRAAEAFARADWDGLADRLTGGLIHDLNGRLASLHSLVHLAHMDAEADLPSYLEGEAGKLGEIVEAMRLLSGTPSAAPEPMAMGEHLPQLIRLHSRDKGLHRIHPILEADNQAPPILVNWCVFARAFLILLNQVGRAAKESGAASVRVSYGPADGGLLLTFSCVREATDETAKEPAGEPGADISAAWQATKEGVGDALKDYDATVETGTDVAGEPFAELWFPSLAMTRKRQA